MIYFDIINTMSAEVLSPNTLEAIKSQLPPHLQRYLMTNINPYGMGLWAQLHCYGAAFSLYTQNLDGYVRVEQTIQREGTPDIRVIPQLLEECFSETPTSRFGDIAIWYANSIHIHGGIFVGTQNNGEPLIASKENIGDYPLIIDTEQSITDAYAVPTHVQYYAPKSESLLLEKFYCPE